MNSPTYIDDYLTSKAFDGQSRLVYGTSGLGGVWGSVQESESIDAVLYALEHGVSVFDTAPSYGNAQEILGRALAQWNGPRPFVSTKVGRLRGEDAFDFKLDFSSEGMTKSLENSLTALGLDHVDLLFLHEPQLVPLENIDAILDTLKRFKEEGLVKKIGVGGNPTVAFLPYITKDNFDVVSGFLKMDACNLSTFQGDIQLLKKEHIAYYAASALHFGLLGNRYEQCLKDGADGNWIIQADLDNAKAIKKIADEQNMPLSSLAQRYLFSIEEADRVVVGARNLEQITTTIEDWKQGKLPKVVFDQITNTILK
ncbi:aldo/keto reductase [Echinicola rosea]|uniref:Oxidoreductase n=1 Tax=Echinicola rosea TaxID=1807691 RepID=A0ABQ1V4G3_9BACT|nr:aldo/keto reductase [Echinicola rosea]GGF36167.1 oxidoreductase [Echinicola rosea]